MAQTQKCRGTATTVFTDDTGALCCIYHQTLVAKKNKTGAVVLNSGGYLTATTKTRINQFANEHCGGRFQVFQRNGAWFVGVSQPYEKNCVPFHDGMTLPV